MVGGIRSLGELARQGGAITATCRACKKAALFSPYELSSYFMQRGWSDAWPGFSKRLVCSGPDGCGARNPYVTWSPKEPPPSPPRPPAPRFVRSVEPVVDTTEWERAKRRRGR